MSDATLPTPRSSSAAPAARDESRPVSSNGEFGSDTPGLEIKDVTMQEESSEGRSDNKQKRKRTR